MNTPIRVRRPDLARECEERRGRSLDLDFPPEHFQVMHRVPFAKNIVHVENVGGDLDQVLGRRCRIGAFPWRFVGGEASICRVVAFVD
jgi:kynurenine formamidase